MAAPSAPTGGRRLERHGQDRCQLDGVDRHGAAGYHVFGDGNATAIATVTRERATRILVWRQARRTPIRRARSTRPERIRKSSPPASATTGSPPDTPALTVPSGVGGRLRTVRQDRCQLDSIDRQRGAAGYHVFRDGNATAIATATTGTNYQDPAPRQADALLHGECV